MTWFGLMSGEVTELDHDSVFVSSRPKGSEMNELFAGTPDTFHQVFDGKSCELQRFRSPRC